MPPRGVLHTLGTYLLTSASKEVISFTPVGITVNFVTISSLKTAEYLPNQTNCTSGEMYAGD
jgi:hypothetical protein